MDNFLKSSIRQTSLVFGLKLFDGMIKQDDGSEQNIKDSCKISVMAGSYSDMDVKADESQVAEKYGRVVQDYKISKEQFDQLRTIPNDEYPIAMDYSFEITGNKHTVVEIHDIIKIDIIPRKEPAAEKATPPKVTDKK